MKKIERSEQEWREKLDAESYAVCREGATEPPFSGALLNKKDDGTYTCKACDNPLFSSDVKYDSGSGWPSFYDQLDDDAIIERRDTSHGMIRVEILCAKCESHLGHLFPDGPNPTGLRYCINSAALNFEDEN